MLNTKDIEDIINKNFVTLFHNSFPSLINSSIGSPVPMFDQNKEQRYWFVPVMVKNKVRGSAILDLNGKVILHGLLTPNVKDEDKLIVKHFFDNIPDKTLNEINSTYPQHTVSTVFFSFDNVPQKWGWLVRLKKNNDSENIDLNIYAGPYGWYEKKYRSDLEG